MVGFASPEFVESGTFIVFLIISFTSSNIYKPAKIKAAMKIKIVLILATLTFIMVPQATFAADSTKVDGYLKPEVCLKTNIRCILKQNGDTLYWCLKSSLQRNLDARRTTTPIKKTRLENLGHCAKIIPIRE